jgi:hypothetical protein
MGGDRFRSMSDTVPFGAKKYYFSVLRIRYVNPGFRILIFTHSGSRIPDPKTAEKERGE